MSRHTTSFTTDPKYRARMEVHNRLGRLRDEARTTAGAMGAFVGNDNEVEMWNHVDALCQGYINGLEAINEVERQNKIASQTRRVSAGHDLEALDFEGSEPA